MRFSGLMTEATLLKRSYRFLAEVSLPNKQKQIIRCPNLGNLLGCDTLGSKIWFTRPQGTHCLPNWELVEVDDGYLVSVNPELMRPLVLEAIKNKKIPELHDYNNILLDNNAELDKVFNEFIILDLVEKRCCLGLQHVTLADNNGVGYVPSNVYEGRDTLQALIQAKLEGYRAVLLFCVAHSGINSLKPTNHIDPQYIQLLHDALAHGVELIAYRMHISLEEATLSHAIPVLQHEYNSSSTSLNKKTLL